MPAAFRLIDDQPNFLIIDKATDCNFHDEQQLGSGLFNQVKSTLGINDLYPVHRLDKMTSGLVVMAKNLATAQQFQQLFEQRKIEKYYIALCAQKPTKKQGLIKGDMAKSRRGMWKLLHSHNNPALTQFFSYGIEPHIRLFVLKPHTGKTHQLRVALASIGSPIIGDPLYSHPHTIATEDKHNSTERGYLHACSLRFELDEQHFQYSILPEQGLLFKRPLVQAKLTELMPFQQLAWPKIN